MAFFISHLGWRASRPVAFRTAGPPGTSPFPQPGRIVAVLGNDLHEVFVCGTLRFLVAVPEAGDTVIDGVEDARRRTRSPTCGYGLSRATTGESRRKPCGKISVRNAGQDREKALATARQVGDPKARYKTCDYGRFHAPVKDGGRMLWIVEGGNYRGGGEYNFITRQIALADGQVTHAAIGIAKCECWRWVKA